MDGEFGVLPVGGSPESVEAEAILRSGMTREEREAATAELIARANDPADPYDGHHGADRTV